MDIQNISTQEALERISRHCPQALSVYFQCINRSDSNGIVYFSKQMVDIEMSENWSKFRNQIKKLALENLIQWHPFSNGISVTLVPLDANE
jgi:hypothetical protein